VRPGAVSVSSWCPSSKRSREFSGSACNYRFATAFLLHLSRGQRKPSCSTLPYNARSGRLIWTAIAVLTSTQTWTATPTTI